MASAICICGELSDSELKKISESYDFFGGNSRKFLTLYRECRKEPFDFCFLNVDSMEMRRNFDNIVWSKKDEMDRLREEANKTNEN